MDSLAPEDWIPGKIFYRTAMYGCYTYSPMALRMAWVKHHRDVKQLFRDDSNFLVLDLESPTKAQDLTRLLGVEEDMLPEYPHKHSRLTAVKGK